MQARGVATLVLDVMSFVDDNDVSFQFQVHLEKKNRIKFIGTKHNMYRYTRNWGLVSIYSGIKTLNIIIMNFYYRSSDNRINDVIVRAKHDIGIVAQHTRTVVRTRTLRLAQTYDFFDVPNGPHAGLL